MKHHLWCFCLPVSCYIKTDFFSIINATDLLVIYLSLAEDAQGLKYISLSLLQPQVKAAADNYYSYFLFSLNNAESVVTIKKYSGFRAMSLAVFGDGVETVLGASTDHSTQ